MYTDNKLEKMPKSLVEATLEILKGNVVTEVEEKTPTVNETYLGLAEEYAGQLDELSKKTLKSYIKRASGADQDPTKHIFDKPSTTLRNTTKYLNDPENKIFGKNYNTSTRNKTKKTDDNRRKGIDTALDKLTKEDVEILESLTYEEFEQLDELSKKTLGSYINKAVDSRDGLNDASDRNHKKGHNSYSSKNHKTSDALLNLSAKQHNKAQKRKEGISRAVSRLAKEEAELDENDFDLDFSQDELDYIDSIINGEDE